NVIQSMEPVLGGVLVIQLEPEVAGDLFFGARETSLDSLMGQFLGDSDGSLPQPRENMRDTRQFAVDMDRWAVQRCVRMSRPGRIVVAPLAIGTTHGPLAWSVHLSRPALAGPIATIIVLDRGLATRFSLPRCAPPLSLPCPDLSIFAPEPKLPPGCQ